MQQRCPSCGRAWVPGEARCPFCGAAPGAVPAAAPAAGAFQVQVTGPGGFPQSYPIPPQGLRVGRGPENGLPLADEQVSRVHATLWVQGGQCYIRDEGSTNGTFVNGQRIAGPHPVRPGDQILIGQTTLRVAMAPVAAPVPAAYPPPAYPAAGGPAFPVPSPYAAPRAAGGIALTVGWVIALLGGILGVVMFFLGWDSILTLSGYDYIRLLVEAINHGVVGEALRESPVLIAFPVAALALILFLLLALIALALPRHRRTGLLVTMLLAALAHAGMTVWVLVTMVQPPSELSVVGVGLWGSLGGSALMLIGTIVDLASAGSRRPY